MPENDLALLVRAASRAGDVALAHWRGDPQVWTKADGSPVSAADLAVDAALHELLHEARPDYGWISEETDDDDDRLGRDAVFVIDPIDGTRAYLEGRPDWALSLAVARGGRVVAGVVHMPARGFTYAAALGQGATLNDTALRASATEKVAGSTMLASRTTYAARNWRGGVPAFERKFRSAMAWRLALVGEAHCDATMTLTPAWEWDIAAGSLIATEAGARVTDRHGAELAFNSPTRRADGLLAAPPALHRAILSSLA